MAMKEIGPGWNRENRNAINDNFKETEARLNTVTAKAIEEIGDEFEAFKAKNDTNFLDAVATVAERDSKYPQPKHGDTVRVTGEAAYYRYETGTGWKKTDEYNPAAIDNLNQQLADNAVSPEGFPGSDFQKVQSAIDYAVANNKAVRFSRFYDITGSTLLFDKTGKGREITYLIGVGGGIIKNDAGSIFSSAIEDTGDISLDSLKFRGEFGNETFVFDCDKLIRISASSCSLERIKMVTAKTRYIQTASFKKNTITAYSGWAYDYLRAYDLTIDTDTIEHGENGIRSGKSSDPDNNTVRIVNSVIEGLSGKAIEFGSSFGLEISGTYMESCLGGYIDLSPATGYHNGLVLKNNTCQQTTEQKTNKVPFIKLKDIGNFGVVSIGNVATGVLYEYGGNTGGGKGNLVSIGDTTYLSSNDEDLIKITNALYADRIIKLGRMDKLSFNKTTLHKSDPVTSASVAAGATVSITIPCTFNPKNGVVDVDIQASGSNSYDVLQIRKTTTGVVVTIKNNSTGNQTFTCSVNCLIAN